jgi:hypothetical protein
VGIKHLSTWHDFDENDKSSYPKVCARVQVKHVNGRVAEGDSFDMLARERLIAESAVIAWRYIKAAGLI